MIGRVADVRVGYFTDPLRMDPRAHLTGDPIGIIHRCNLNRQPWRYIIDHHSVPPNIDKRSPMASYPGTSTLYRLGLGRPLVVVDDHPN